VQVPELTTAEQRVLGALIEKRWTTPDAYPLSLNALRLACNQATSRDPVTDYDEATVREAAQRLSRHGLARLASGAGSRATKYRHLAEDALGLGRPELAVLCILLLRGPQTVGELKVRTERLAEFENLEEVDRVLERLGDEGYVERFARRPGQKEDRFAHRLSADEGYTSPGTADGPLDADLTPAGNPPSSDAPARDDLPPGLAARVAALEAEVATLRAELEASRRGSGP
jgi:hypothetical protein